MLPVAASAVTDALNRVWVALEPLNLPMAEDLIIHKLLAGRIIDSADVAALLRAIAQAWTWRT